MGGTILTSPDLVTWTPRPSGTNYALRSIAFGRALFVTVGYNGTLLTSTDTIRWTARSLSLAASLSNIVFMNDRFEAYGESPVPGGGSVRFRSSDGEQWTLDRPVLSPEQRTNTAEIFDGRQTIAVSDEGVRSRIGEGPWITRYAALPSMSAVTYGGGVFAAGGNFGGILVSRDGVQWTQASPSDDTRVSTVFDLAYGNGRFVTAQYGVVTTSNDGMTWTRTPLSPPDSVGRRIAFGAGVFVTAAGSLRVSQDGVAWTTTTENESYLAVTFGDGKFIAANRQGRVVTSTNGMTWTVLTTALDYPLRDIATGNGVIVAIDDSRNAIRSTDGVQWAANPSGLRSQLRLRFARERFFIVGDEGQCASSTDGLQWATCDTPSRNPLWDVAASTDTIVVVGDTDLMTYP
jgi:hypothetical protein